MGSALVTFLLGAFLCGLVSVKGAITVYSQKPYEGTETGTANVASYTGAAAYDPIVLTPPLVPKPLPPMHFKHKLSAKSTSVHANLSIPHGQSGAFFGFSIEFSVVDQILGINGSFLQVPFLNLMSNLAARGGSVRVRIGGTTQETATMVDSLPDGKMMEKGNAMATSDNPLQISPPPPLLYTPEMVYMLADISALVPVQWYLGIPFNDTAHPRLEIAEAAEAVLGDRLLGFQVGNEPDQYANHGIRPMTYNASNYADDFGVVAAALQANPSVPLVDKRLIGPSISGDWKLEDVWDTGFLDLYNSSLAALSVVYYPDNNCAHGLNASVDPQSIFNTYLNHTAAQSVVEKYLNSTQIAQSYGLPFVMLETNTASCGGFAGISDSFGSALWALDYGLQLAYSNFTNALLHVGGQGVYYNPFTPPTTNQSTFHSWTVGPVFYSALMVAEVFGKSNQSRIIDMQLNKGNIFTPGYAVYDDEVLARIALINFISDPSGESDYTAVISITHGRVPVNVQVKYLVAPSVSAKENITWANQTFGPNFASDGRLSGTVDIQTIACDVAANTCSIRVPAPGAALVFLSGNPAIDNESPSPTTWSTTAYTKTTDTVGVDPSVLATSNGHQGMDELEGRTAPSRKRAQRNGAMIGRGGGAWYWMMFGLWCILFGY